MAEKFMTRRERREAERRAADEAYDAQQSPEADEAEAPAEVREPKAVEAPQSEPEQTSAPADTPEVPRFASRGERKRFLREHDLPSDISTAAIPQVLAERESGDSTADASAGSAPQTESGMHGSAGAPPTAVVAGTPDDESAITAPVTQDGPGAGDSSVVEGGPVRGDASAGTATDEFSADEEAADNDEEAADNPASDDSAPDDSTPHDELSGAGAAEAVVDDAAATDSADPVDADALIAAGAPAEDADVKAGAASGTAPDFDLARHRVDASPSGPDFETSSTAVIAPSAIGDFDAPLRRRTPVVKPPTGSNIRVVTGALPIITPEDLDDNPPTTPLSTIDEASLGTGTFSTASRTSAGQTTVATAARSDVWHGAGAASADEEEESDELEEPPAKPMSARSVTNEDGEILVAERNSMVPYIVLGAAGFVALALVVIALFLLL